MHSEDWKKVIISALLLGSICFGFYSCTTMQIAEDQEQTVREKQMIDAGYKRISVSTGVDVWMSPDMQE